MGATRVNPVARARFGLAGADFGLGEGFFFELGLGEGFFFGRGFIAARLRSFFFAMLPLELLWSPGRQPKRKSLAGKREQTSRVTRMSRFNCDEVTFCVKRSRQELTRASRPTTCSLEPEALPIDR